MHHVSPLLILVSGDRQRHNLLVLRRSIVSILSSVLLWPVVLAVPAQATILWSDPGPILVHENGEGTNILHGAVQRDHSASDALYFKFHVDPLSDVSSEPYSAGFQLFEGNEERLGVGSSLKEWAYGAFNAAETGTNNTVTGDVDLHSASPESYEPGRFLFYELPRRGIGRTIVFKVQYVPNGDDLVTVWVDPNLALGATEQNQLTNLTTYFKANAVFNQIRLRHHGSGDGWIFSDMALATSFDDFIVTHLWQRWWFLTTAAMTILASLFTTVRILERRKFQRQLQVAEQERALERERGRIARDLHDELGSSLTRLSLLSGLIRADKDNPQHVEAHAGKISQAADQTVRALEEIVWAVRPDSDTLQSLVDYIAHFAHEMFDGNPTRCRLDLPHDLPAQPLPPDVRHNIFLIVKEALTNTLKHADAAEVRMAVKVSAHTLEILVQDDGKGFDPRSSLEGRRHGLGNMRRRAEAIRGKLEWQSASKRGTAVRLVVDLKSGINAAKT